MKLFLFASSVMSVLPLLAVHVQICYAWEIGKYHLYQVSSVIASLFPFRQILSHE